MTSRLAQHFPFWFALSKLALSDDRFPRYACRVDEILYLSFLPRVEQGHIAGAQVSGPVYALAAEIDRVEAYRDAVSPDLCLFPGLSKPHEFSFQYALTQADPENIHYLPRYHPGHEYGMDEADYYVNDAVSQKMFNTWAARVARDLNVCYRGIPVTFCLSDRSFEPAAPDVMAQAHRWFAWHVAACSTFRTIHSTVAGSALRLGEAATNGLLREVIELPREPREDFYKDMEFERQRWRIWNGESGDHTGSPKSMIDLVILLQRSPSVIRHFLFNVVIRVAYSSIQDEAGKLMKLLEELRFFPLSIFFLKHKQDRNVLLFGQHIEFEKPHQLPADLRAMANQYIFDASRCMLIYCANLGVNPEKEIMRLGHEYGVRFIYEELMIQHEVDMFRRVFSPGKIPAGNVLPWVFQD